MSIRERKVPLCNPRSAEVPTIHLSCDETQTLAHHDGHIVNLEKHNPAIRTLEEFCGKDIEAFYLRCHSFS